MKTKMNLGRYIPLVLPLICWLPVSFFWDLQKPLQRWVVNSYQARQLDPIVKVLETGYAVNRFTYGLFFCIPIFYVVIYVISLLLAKGWTWLRARKAASEAEQENGQPEEQAVS